MKKDINITSLPPGRYWIGDLCYVMHDRWQEFCSMLFPAGREDSLKGSFLFDGHRGWQHRTAYGDGKYSGNGNIPGLILPRSFGVDSGLIGIIPEGLVGHSSEDKPENGLYISVNSEVICRYCEGEFLFICAEGVLVIDTGLEDADANFD